MTAPEQATFEDLLNITPNELRPIVVALKNLILELDVKTCEVVRLGDKAATYGVGPKKMSEGYVYIMPHKKWVNLGFYKGAALEDKHGLLEGTGKKLRHIKMHHLEAVHEPEVRSLKQLAIAERQRP